MKLDKLRTADDLLVKLREEIRMRGEAIMKGAPQTFDAYQNLVGVVTGLRVAEQLLVGLLESNANDPDDST